MVLIGQISCGFPYKKVCSLLILQLDSRVGQFKVSNMFDTLLNLS